MTRLTHAACLVLALSGVALAAPPDAPKDLKAKPGQLVRVVVKGANTGYLRNFADEDAFFGEMVSPVKGERHFVFQPPTDKPKPAYVLGFFTKGEDSGVATTITVEGASPKVDPVVDPKVDPTPAPTPKNGAFVIVVANDTAPSVGDGKVIDGPTLRALKTAGKCRIYGSRVDADQIKSRGYDRMMADYKVQPPCVLVVDGGGKAVLAQTLPDSDPALAAILKGVIQP